MTKEWVGLATRLSPFFLVVTVDDAFKNAGITVKKPSNISALEIPFIMIVLSIILVIFIYTIIIISKENQLKMKIGFIFLGLMLFIIMLIRLIY